jgi:hypothetical protein
MMRLKALILGSKEAYVPTVILPFAALSRLHNELDLKAYLAIVNAKPTQ